MERANLITHYQDPDNTFILRHFQDGDKTYRDIVNTVEGIMTLRMNN
ncbi:MAG: hypothetical protein ACLR23_09615 [Clostridia bacterium]